MKTFLKNYKFSIILLGSIALGGFIGLYFGEAAMVLEPLGTLFINLLFMIIVPLVFFSIASSIANMDNVGRLKNIMFKFFIVISVLGVLFAILGLVINSMFVLFTPEAAEAAKAYMGEPETYEEMTFFARLVDLFTVEDFSELFSKDNLLALVVFSVIFGTATSLIGEKGKPMANVLKSGSDIFMKFINIILWYAPIGLGAYFAVTVAQFGSVMVESYVRAFLIYTLATLFIFFVIYPLIVYLTSGKHAFKLYWKNITPVAATSISTCSSSACIPLNVDATKKMGVTDDVADTVIPLGTNMNKLGSVLLGVLKITFLFQVFGMEISGLSTYLMIIIVAVLCGLVVGALPGGGAIASMLIITVFGFPAEAAPLIVIYGAICDIPATLLNATGNTMATCVVNSLVEGRNWAKEKLA